MEGESTAMAKKLALSQHKVEEGVAFVLDISPQFIGMYTKLLCSAY